MARYLISDHHFGHGRIIDYCDRPFSSLGEMDTEMLNLFYDTVTPDDVLIHLGDIAMDMRDGDETIEKFKQLNGDLLVRGNHDSGLTPDEAPFPVVHACQLEHRGYEFYCVHRPEDVPEWWDGWTIHGHHHNNDLEEHPFIRFDEQRINVSAEVLDYEPIQLDELTQIIGESHQKPRIPKRSNMDI